MLSLLILKSANKKNLQIHFWILIFLFLSYSFGIETINTFIHSSSSLVSKNHTRFQTKMGKVFSHDVTKIQATKLSTLLRFYFHHVLERLKTNFHTNFHFQRVLGFLMAYAWICKLLRDVAFTWRPRELSCRLKKWRISGNFAIYTVHVME